MRFVSSLLLMLCLAACQRSGQQNTEAVRQGVIERLTKTGLNVAGMDVQIASVKFNGEQADANVNITPKGVTGGTPMPFQYHLEHQNNKWVVVGPASSAGHSGTVDPNAGGENPHGGAMPPAMPPAGADNPHGGAGKMPSPQDLPPATKK